MHVGEHARAIVAVGLDASVRQPLQHVGHAQPLRGGGLHVRKRESRSLVRQGDVGAASAVREERVHRVRKYRRRHIDRRVFQRDAGLRCEQRVQARRLSLRDGVADDGVT
jgi:hypothetical protein